MDELYVAKEQYDYILKTENSLIGCLMVNPQKTMRSIRGIVSAGDFFTETGKAAYSAARALIDNGKDCDIILIQEEAENQGMHLEDGYCRECMVLTPTVSNAAELARIIHKKAETREIKKICSKMVDESLPTDEGFEKIGELLRGCHGKTRTPLEAANNFIDYILAAHDGKIKPFLSTGYQSLDEQLSGGLIASGLVTFAGRPGMGKTSLVLNIGDNVAAAGKTVLFISLEMTEEQLWARRAAILSGLSHEAILKGQISDEDKEWERIMTATNELTKRPLIIHDSPCTLEEIEQEARCTENLGLLIIDHIGLITRERGRNRYEETTDISHRLKQLAISLHIPVLALSQLNRDTEKRDNKVPTLSDLRDSGSIEEDSDVVCLLYRPSYYMAAKDRPKPWQADPIEVTVGKNRHGMTGVVTMDYFGINTRFRERNQCA